jgi:hypothetical protein
LHENHCRGCLPRRVAWDAAQVCRSCAESARAWLRELPDIHDDLLTPPKRRPGQRVSGSSEPPQALSDVARRAREAIRAVLVSWCMVLREDRDVSFPRDDIPAIADHIDKHLSWLLESEHADQLLHDLHGIVTEGRCQAYPFRPDRLYIGDCPIEIEHPDGTLAACGTALRARADERLVTCLGCGTFAAVEWWQTQLGAFGNDLATGAVASAYLSGIHGRVVPESTIRTWADRGYVPRADRDAKGRTLYRLSDLSRHAETLYTRTAQ